MASDDESVEAKDGTCSMLRIFTIGGHIAFASLLPAVLRIMIVLKFKKFVFSPLDWMYITQSIS
jgi:hypothetical protein